MQYITLAGKTFDKQTLDKIIEENRDKPVSEIVLKLEQSAIKKIELILESWYNLDNHDQSIADSGSAPYIFHEVYEHEKRIADYYVLAFTIRRLCEPDADRDPEEPNRYQFVPGTRAL